MRKFHLAILAILASVSIYGQSALSFTPCTTPIDFNYAQNITSDTNNVVYITTDNGSTQKIYKSIDYGNTYSYIAGSNPVDIIALGVPGSIKLFSKYQKSTDGGINWPLHTLFPVVSGDDPKFLKINNLTAYFYGINSYKTIDGGNTWLPITSPQNTLSIAGSTYNLINNNFYLGNNDTYFPYFNGTNLYYLNSKNFGATYSYSLNVFPSLHNAGLINFNNTSNFLLFGSNGDITEFPLNYSSTTITGTTVTYSVGGTPFHVDFFGKSTIVNNYFLIIDKSSSLGSTSSILRMAIPTSTTTIGVNELTKASVLNVYPNPCLNKLNVGVNNNTNYIVSNQLGQCILSGITNDFINTETLVPGIYFLILKNAPPIKFIKE